MVARPLGRLGSIFTTASVAYLVAARCHKSGRSGKYGMTARKAWHPMVSQHLDSSTQLLVAAANGDEDAFAQFYRDQAESVLRYFYRRTASPETAADLTAETFASALSSLARYRPASGTGRAWLFGIAHHELSRYVRWRRIDSRARRKLGMRIDLAIDAESYERIEELHDLRELAPRIQEAVRKLSPKLAAAVRLRIHLGLPFAEVARRLQCSEEAARARVSRALSRLARELEEAP